MSLNKLTGGLFSIARTITKFSAKHAMKVAQQGYYDIMGASNVEYPKLANNMQSGGNFFDMEFDDKTGKPTSVRYKDPLGVEYYYNYGRKNWQRL